jgi:hypothetical protein
MFSQIHIIHLSIIKGGIYGYKELLEKIANPEHEEHQEMIEWLNACGYDNFDPAKFNPGDVVFGGLDDFLDY